MISYRRMLGARAAGAAARRRQLPRVAAAEPSASPARTWRSSACPSAFDDGVAIGRATLDGHDGLRRRAGRRVHGRRRRRGAWRQAGRPAAARPARPAGRGAVAGRIGRRAIARGQCRPDRGVGSDARAARRACRRHPGDRADRRRQRLLRRHGHRGALRRPHRDERCRAPGDVGARGDRGVPRRGGIRFARPCAGLAHHRRQAPLADRRLRRAGRRRRRGLSRGGCRRARCARSR